MGGFYIVGNIFGKTVPKCHKKRQIKRINVQLTSVTSICEEQVRQRDKEWTVSVILTASLPANLAVFPLGVLPDLVLRRFTEGESSLS